jgi:hypothetical protein
VLDIASHKRNFFTALFPLVLSYSGKTDGEGGSRECHVPQAGVAVVMRIHDVRYRLACDSADGRRDVPARFVRTTGVDEEMSARTQPRRSR